MKYGVPYFYNQLGVEGETVAGGSRNLTQQGLVIPTGGFMLDPYKKAVRGIRKDEKKSSQRAKDRLLRGQKGYENQQALEVKRFERLADEYEKEYGFRPELPELTPYKAPVYKPGPGRKTQYRNPIFLKNGGKVKVKKR